MSSDKTGEDVTVLTWSVYKKKDCYTTSRQTAKSLSGASLSIG